MRLLAEEHPVLEGFEGERVAADPEYLFQDANAAANEFGRARAQVLRVVRGLGPAELAREGQFAGRTVTLAGVVAMVAGHDEEHRGDIGRLLAELG